MSEEANEVRRGDGRERLLAAAVAHFAENGIGDASLRQVAAAIGTSHRMLIYHFGNREGLLTAVVGELEHAERDLLESILARPEVEGRRLAWEFWTHVADVVDIYGPLYFELTSKAMHGDDLDAPLRAPNVAVWVAALTKMYVAAGFPKSQALVLARFNLAAARGLLHDYLLTRDRKAVDQAMAMFDWLVYRTPNPVASVARTSRRWVSPTEPQQS
ncbi:TetR family transcriptional regulator [Kribbella sp. VKM Ac-2571]|uniref:TetR/AcrR family transcriptional regulator n=1 Tax=Kribbella sp. VKM Ac-2571 TaxID=2512222 RepID=UPI00105C62A6|nr:TetR/AcrR family transcriptional regulator [Kribbella sp. VKM Ac-2571]TDO56655.1 TetR family transcriptional regulator [Kribbella sp. VKM Ac-2571]